MKRSNFIKISLVSFISVLANIPKIGFTKSIKKDINLSDIEGGVYVTRHTKEANVSYMYQIGYILGEKNKYILNSLADGWCYDNLGFRHTKEALLEYLNKNNYRLATKEEIIEAISKCHKNFR